MKKCIGMLRISFFFLNTSSFFMCCIFRIIDVPLWNLFLHLRLQNSDFISYVKESISDTKIPFHIQCRDSHWALIHTRLHFSMTSAHSSPSSKRFLISFYCSSVSEVTLKGNIKFTIQRSSIYGVFKYL